MSLLENTMGRWTNLKRKYENQDKTSPDKLHQGQVNWSPFQHQLNLSGSCKRILNDSFMLNAWNQGIDPLPSVNVTSHVCCRKWLYCGLGLKVIWRKCFCDLTYYCTGKLKEMHWPQQPEPARDLTEPHQPHILEGNRDREITWGENFLGWLGPRKTSTS